MRSTRVRSGAIVGMYHKSALSFTPISAKTWLENATKEVQNVYSTYVPAMASDLTSYSRLVLLTFIVCHKGHKCRKANKIIGFR